MKKSKDNLSIGAKFGQVSSQPLLKDLKCLNTGFFLFCQLTANRDPPDRLHIALRGLGVREGNTGN